MFVNKRIAAALWACFLFAAPVLCRADEKDTLRGEPISPLKNYQQVLSRLAREIVLHARQDKDKNVLVIWCLDQSESMADDRHEIRNQIPRLYQQLAAPGVNAADRVETAVTSFGDRFLVHTRKPTSDVQKIRQAIDSVPNDPSGKERICQAVGRAVQMYQQHASQQKQKMMLFLVTDESGDRAENETILETAIDLAKQANCCIYILGREAVFGGRYAYFRWVHPQTKRTHWIAQDRGPETALLQVLQTDGFGRRQDALHSGFGPYEQVRMVRETGGIFFTLPSVGMPLAAKQPDYRLELIRPYMPDLHSRKEVLADRDRSPLRRAVCRVVDELDPFEGKHARQINLRQTFSTNASQFFRQVTLEHKQVTFNLILLAQVQRMLAEVKEHRQREKNRRWQANYDLAVAQLATFEARLRDYAAYLERVKAEPPPVPGEKGKMQWQRTTRKALSAPAASSVAAERATALLKKVITDHPGTPWAAMANLELHRGMGVTLKAVPTPPPRVVPKPIPIPKL